MPATYDEVITVSALADFDGQPSGLGGATCVYDVDDTLAAFSNRHRHRPDRTRTMHPLDVEDGGYNTNSSTSIASPNAAGSAALYFANNPGTLPATDTSRPSPWPTGG